MDKGRLRCRTKKRVVDGRPECVFYIYIEDFCELFATNVCGLSITS